MDNIATTMLYTMLLVLASAGARFLIGIAAGVAYVTFNIIV